jgi:hypothetical protein
MMREAIEKMQSNSKKIEQAIWKENEAMIGKLCGLRFK